MRRSLGPVLAVVALVLLGLVAPLVPASAAEGDLLATTMAVSAPSQARVGTRAAVTAVLSATDGAARVGGVSVALDKLRNGGWVEVDRATTSGSGTASFSPLVGSADPTYRVVFDGDGTYAGTTSSSVVVTTVVVTSVLTVTGPRRIVDEKSGVLRITWKGSDGRAVVGGLVNLYTRPTSRTTWTKVSSYRTGATGVLTRTVRPRVDTLYKVRGAAGAGWRGDSSPVLLIDNVPPAAPVVLPAKAPRPKVILAPQQRASGAGANVVVTKISDSLWRRMTGISWHQGCPVGRSQLRLIRVNYFAFDGYRRRGNVVVRSTKVGKFTQALQGLYAARIPIRYLYLPDRFGYSSRSRGANDYKSMEADNSSVFNCRGVTGNVSVRSPHSYGGSFDINTWENPYHSAKGWVPNGWWVTHSDPRYAWRSSKHQVVRIMKAAGFRWTYGNGDSQHFDA